ncbi:hypothetical protein GIB67_021631 [Kingdonia uniflora]|uniref:Uncharacterized protein n=1 Tax=Kingdonia uniflora TaxID=39325 RepID=A0A7J7KY16_9MAGN|nr:hypothetical protein GIB67_021631 [Kingdonia uniflora]
MVLSSSSSLAKQLQRVLQPSLSSSHHHHLHNHLRCLSTSLGFSTRRNNNNQLKPTKKSEEKSEWWAVDGEMHEIGDNVPPRERFVIPRDNLPNRRRKQMREQFMRRTRLALKDGEHEPWCKRYMELYQELRENWERLYWDEGYSKKLAHDHANYESAEEDDLDFSPYRKRQSYAEQNKEQGFQQSRLGDTREKVGQIRDNFEYDREKRMRQRVFACVLETYPPPEIAAFAPMIEGTRSNFRDSHSKNEPFNTERNFPRWERE